MGEITRVRSSVIVGEELGTLEKVGVVDVELLEVVVRR